jgi:hypothetical protein
VSNKVFEAAQRFLSFPGCGDVATPFMRTYEISGVYRYMQVVGGHINPAVQIPDERVAGRAAVVQALIDRYGPGFGTPIEPPGNPVPDRQHAAIGYGDEEARPLPNAETWQKLGLDPLSHDPTEVWDWRVLSAFNRKVIVPMNAGLEPGAEVPAPPVIPPPHPPVVVPPVQPPAASSLSAPEKRVDELFYGFVVHQVFPAVRPALIELLKMVRKALGAQ